MHETDKQRKLAIALRHETLPGEDPMGDYSIISVNISNYLRSL